MKNWEKYTPYKADISESYFNQILTKKFRKPEISWTQKKLTLQDSQTLKILQIHFYCNFSRLWAGS